MYYIDIKDALYPIVKSLVAFKLLSKTAGFIDLRWPIDTVSSSRRGPHYENTPMQHTANFHDCKKDNLQMKNCYRYIFLFLLKTLIVGTR